MEFDIKKLKKSLPDCYIFCDLEASSTSFEKGDILSMSCIAAQGEDLTLDNSFTGYAKPRNFKNWNHYAQKIHGITKEKAKTFPPARETLIKLLHFLKKYKSDDNSPIPFVFHGKNKFDYKLLRIMFEREQLEGSFDKVFSTKYVISTCDMFQFFVQLFGIQVEDHKLCTMADLFGIELDHHEVVSDTKACYEGYKIMRKCFNL